jgi:3-hydroxyisobutyrate dehydrogenase-like beta-hydroxyacid dehydrogenase
MARKSRKNVGIIGLGIIGARVAQALRAAGFHVFVWNRTAKPAPNFLGSPVDVAEICDIVQIFVSDSQALFQVIDAFGGALTENHTIVCSATVGPEATIEAARLVKAKGARFLDAPFTGSKLAAEKSQLVYYVGGEDAAFKKAEPVLKASSKSILRCGEIGHAAVLKVATNMITAVTTQTLAEALALVRKAGLSPETFKTAIENNACRSGTTDIKLPKMVAADYDPHFSLKHMFKDVQLAIHMANALDIEVPATTVTAGVMYGALNHGWADLDFASIFKLYDGAFPAGRVEPPPQIAGPASVPEKAALIPESPRADVIPMPGPSAETPLDSLRSNGETKVMEVVTDVPRDAKPASDATPEEPKSPEANDTNPEANEADDGKKPKPLNRIRRFFSQSSK